MNTVTQERLRELFDYDQKQGYLIRKARTSPNTRIGEVAGRINNKGYRQTMVDNHRYMEHRLVWLYVYGAWPLVDVDHINGNRSDNRIENLRLATRAENQQNVGMRSHNTSGYIGVTWYKKLNKWRAQIKAHGKKLHIGLFDCPAEAHKAYLAKKAELHLFQPIPRGL